MPNRNASSIHSGPHAAHRTEVRHPHSVGHAEVLDLDAQVVGYLGQLTEWVSGHLHGSPSAVLDIGAGSGSGTLALANRFPHADLIALEQSAEMIEHLDAAMVRSGVGHRVSAVQADADQEWPQIGTFDVAWASSSLHHMTNPSHVLRSAYAALNVGGVLAVLEMDGLPQFLPVDLGIGRPGLEERCRDAMKQAGWNAYPNWTPYLQRAGFELLEKRTFSYLRTPAPAGADRYAQRIFTNVRTRLADRLAQEDVKIIDQLLDDGASGSLTKRRDLVVRSTRTAWVARRVRADETI